MGHIQVKLIQSSNHDSCEERLTTLQWRDHEDKILQTIYRGI